MFFLGTYLLPDTGTWNAQSIFDGFQKLLKILRAWSAVYILRYPSLSLLETLFSKRQRFWRSTCLKFSFPETRSSPGGRNLLLHINYSVKLSRTNSNVRFHELCEFPTPKVIKMFDLTPRTRGPQMSPVLLLRHSLLNSHIHCFVSSSSRNRPRGV